MIDAEKAPLPPARALYAEDERRDFPDDYDVGPVDHPFQAARRIASLRALEDQYQDGLARKVDRRSIRFARDLQDRLVGIWRRNGRPA